MALVSVSALLGKVGDAMRTSSHLTEFFVVRCKHIPYDVRVGFVWVMHHQRYDRWLAYMTQRTARRDMRRWRRADKVRAR